MTRATVELPLTLVLRTLLRLARGQSPAHLISSLEAALQAIEKRR